ncbi:Rv3235 family protein [Kitasatospora sp. NPDC006697]|uniref:Rv3235 family protein n=1 Tax=Kitasatospora sp. NPDC006697 TaxID=3364020 RepID=UPI003695F2BC
MTQTALAAPLVTIRPLGRRPGHSHPHPPAHTPAHAPAHPSAHAEPRTPRHPRAACALPAPPPDADEAAARRELARRFAQRLVEVLAGARPAGQLLRHTTHDGYRQLSGLVRRGPLRSAAGRGRLGLGPVHDSSPAPDAVEVCVRVAAGHRQHVVAFRLERHRRTEVWQCAAVDTR